MLYCLEVLSFKVTIMDLDILKIRASFDCDYDNGVLYSIDQSRKRSIAGYINECGYTRVMFNSKLTYAHRVIWSHYYLEQPPEIIDHIDRNPLNNSIKNLRASTPRLNQLNRKVSKNNTSGYTGVSYIDRLNKYKSTIYINSKPTHLGVFDNAEEARDAYEKRKEQEIKNGKL